MNPDYKNEVEGNFPESIKLEIKMKIKDFVEITMKIKMTILRPHLTAQLSRCLIYLEIAGRFTDTVQASVWNIIFDQLCAAEFEW